MYKLTALYNQFFFHSWFNMVWMVYYCLPQPRHIPHKTLLSTQTHNIHSLLMALPSFHKHFSSRFNEMQIFSGTFSFYPQSLFLLSFDGARQLYYRESLHPMRHPVTPAVIGSAIKDTLWNM
jgi:hypothetical protein